MDQIWLILLSLSGLLSLTLSKPQEYVLVRQFMPWKKAQDYCRTNHLDLATVQSDEDWAGLKKLAAEEAFYAFAWFGLYSDIDSWRWTHGDESLTYKAWSLYRCGTINFDGTWYEFDCDTTRYFVCIDVSANRTEMVLVKTLKTWHDAQKYCRARHTDLATVRTKSDSEQITVMLDATMPPVWFGLYRDSWKWSDQASITGAIAERLNGPNENCAVANYYSTVDDVTCTLNYYCFCSTVKLKRQVIRLKVKSRGNEDGSTLRRLVLDKVQQALADLDVSLAWRTQANGNVFQKMLTVQKSSNVSVPVC